MFVRDLQHLPLLHAGGCQLDSLLFSPQLAANKNVGPRLDPPVVPFPKRLRALMSPPCHPLEISLQRKAGVRLGQNDNTLGGSGAFRVVSEVLHSLVSLFSVPKSSGNRTPATVP